MLGHGQYPSASSSSSSSSTTVLALQLALTLAATTVEVVSHLNGIHGVLRTGDLLEGAEPYLTSGTQ